MPCKTDLKTRSDEGHAVFQEGFPEGKDGDHLSVSLIQK